MEFFFLNVTRLGYMPEIPTFSPFFPYGEIPLTNTSLEKNFPSPSDKFRFQG